MEEGHEDCGTIITHRREKTIRDKMWSSERHRCVATDTKLPTVYDDPVMELMIRSCVSTGLVCAAWLFPNICFASRRHR
jgi:hypothetical protein